MPFRTNVLSTLCTVMDTLVELIGIWNSDDMVEDEATKSVASLRPAVPISDAYMSASAPVMTADSFRLAATSEVPTGWLDDSQPGGGTLRSVSSSSSMSRGLHRLSLTAVTESAMLLSLLRKGRSTSDGLGLLGLARIGDELPLARGDVDIGVQRPGHTFRRDSVATSLIVPLLFVTFL